MILRRTRYAWRYESRETFTSDRRSSLYPYRYPGNRRDICKYTYMHTYMRRYK